MSVTGVGFIPVSPMPIRGDFVTQTVKHNTAAQSVKKVDPKIIHSTAADVQKMGLAFNRKLQFVVDHRSNEVIVKVIDKETDKVIKELPPEELQRLHRNLKKAIGLLFDEMV